ncbi:Serine aminopeptidase, S33 [Enhydrobacter aerosaccus]|uniref:Serine aminopeptidase, S33 n=1 Tax=Enhydrobacter aerosaccus TaxID=225324 RepID=A0A1T4NJ69_9HYPH|nr:alpha/beta hydrolase [Enhydrobacter aerosaccus]SJZ79340.1 Serine aminopeptidase, S33 [Enhydrobacter aerosaccus]
MSFLVRSLAVLVLIVCSLAPTLPAQADEKSAVQVVSGISYELVDRWDVDRLNRILTVDGPKFLGISVAFTPARNAVRLYRITYSSVIPERGNKPTTATGLLAIPDTGTTSFPMVSYQHGTVYGKEQVPSFPDQSPETQLALAQFAGQGYVVIGADYFGMGRSTEPEGYLVKGSHQQATYDMLMASRAVLDHLKISTPKLFLGGWSQGGFVTMALLEKLENSGVPVAAAATASAGVDIFAGMSGFLDFPRKNDAAWMPIVFILSSFSFENYYGAAGLARSLINDDYYDLSRRIYERQSADVTQMPADLHKLIRAEYFDPQFFAASTFGRLLLDKANAYRWIIKSPVRNYYGQADEIISVGLGQLAMNYQRSIGSGNTKVEAISTGDTDHRGTFGTALPLWKTWFDGL